MSVLTPAFTEVFESPDTFVLPDGSVYIAGQSGEERAHGYERLCRGAEDVIFWSLIDSSRSLAVLEADDGHKELRLRSARDMNLFVEEYRERVIWLDITGLPHAVWAPLVRALRRSPGKGKVVYFEPSGYRFSSEPTPRAIFDLSEKIEGIAPLPGFASLTTSSRVARLCVALLGFEGARLAYALESLQPQRQDILPVVGVPGFRLEFPFLSYWGNLSILRDSGAWKNVRMAPANCPFSVYALLSELQASAPTRSMQVLLVGTKPHALGAVLYCVDHPQAVELVYDFPDRRADRTSGIERVCVFNLDRFPTAVTG